MQSRSSYPKSHNTQPSRARKWPSWHARSFRYGLASDWMLSVGIVSQGIIVLGEEVPQPIHELVHPSWGSQVAKASYRSRRAEG